MSQGGASRRSIVEWFTPTVLPEDVFVAPDFNLAQFFYTRDTARRLADALDHYRDPCCLCTPRLAAEWHERGRVVRLLDYDERFQALPGYRQFDLLKPDRQLEAFDVVVFDPIFIDAATLSRAVRMAMASSPKADLFMSFPVERERELLAAFSGYGLKRTEFAIRCCNVKPQFQELFALYGPREIGVGSEQSNVADG